MGYLVGGIRPSNASASAKSEESAAKSASTETPGSGITTPTSTARAPATPALTAVPPAAPSLEYHNQRLHLLQERSVRFECCTCVNNEEM